MSTSRIHDVQKLLRSRAELADLGYTGRTLQRALEAGEITRVRRGWYVHTARWRELRPEGRHLAHVLAVVRDGPDAPGPVSHVSAAAVWGLPLYRHSPRKVHMTIPPARRSSDSDDVRRHVADLGASDVTERDGVRVTSLGRTVFDIVRMLAPEAAVAAADAALRLMAWDAASREYDHAQADVWRAELDERISRAAGARGVMQARRVVQFADGRAELPGESVSRLQLVRLGFAVPDLQVKVPAPRGHYWVDFGLEDVAVWGEFDGVGKYTEPMLLAGRTSQQAVLEEKRREDWIRGTTGRAVLRWEMMHIATASTLGRRLADFGVRPLR